MKHTSKISSFADDDWRQRASCLRTDVKMFFPDKRGSTKEARLLCDQCVVRQACAEYAIVNQIHHGVWGGLSERQRRRIRKERNLE